MFELVVGGSVINRPTPSSLWSYLGQAAMHYNLKHLTSSTSYDLSTHPARSSGDGMLVAFFHPSLLLLPSPLGEICDLQTKDTGVKEIRKQLGEEFMKRGYEEEDDDHDRAKDHRAGDGDRTGVRPRVTTEEA